MTVAALILILAGLLGCLVAAQSLSIAAGVLGAICLVVGIEGLYLAWEVRKERRHLKLKDKTQ